jgi:hypothetical protein
MVGQLTQITSPLLGWIADHYGAKILANIMALTCWLGLTFFLVAAETGLDQFLFSALACLGMTTWMGGLLSVQVGLYFRSKLMQSRVIFVLNSLFDAGSVTYLGLWGIGEWTGASLTAIIGGYTVLAVFVFGGAAYFWNVAVPDREEEEEDAKYDAKAASDDDNGISNSEEASSCAPRVSQESQHVGESEATKLECDGTPVQNEKVSLNEPEMMNTSMIEASATDGESSGAKVVGSEPSLNGEDIKNEDDAGVYVDTDTRNAAASDDPPAEKEYIIVAERSSRQQLTSGPYILLVVFFSFHVTANQWNLTTQRDFLAYLGDDDQDNKYLTIFTLLMPASIVGIPFVDAVVANYGFVGGLQGINLLALAYNVIKVRLRWMDSCAIGCVAEVLCTGRSHKYILSQVSSDSLNVQVAGFVLFSFFRCFLFSVTFSMLPAFLDQKVIGKATGFLYFFGGIISFLNIPMKDLAVEHLDGDFFAPNLVYTILVLPCIAAAWGIGQTMKREKAAKDARILKKLQGLNAGALATNDFLYSNI